MIHTSESLILIVNVLDNLSIQADTTLNYICYLGLPGNVVAQASKIPIEFARGARQLETTLPAFVQRHSPEVRHKNIG